MLLGELMEQLNQIKEVWKDILWLSLWDLFFLISRFSHCICFSCDTVVDQSGRVCLFFPSSPPSSQQSICMWMGGWFCVEHGVSVVNKRDDTKEDTVCIAKRREEK